MIGQLASVAREYSTGMTLVTFRCQGLPEHLAELSGRDLDITAKPHRQGRSRSQNDYYWVLLGKLADRLEMGKAELHNRLLAEYGQDMVVDEQLVYVILPDTDETARKVIRDPNTHMRPTPSRTSKGARVYVLMRPSHTYDVAEMSRLVDGLIEEAKEQGVETLSPYELERMRMYERKKEFDSKRDRQ